jgi:hypothetical protein
MSIDPGILPTPGSAVATLLNSGTVSATLVHDAVRELHDRIAALESQATAAREPERKRR